MNKIKNLLKRSPIAMVVIGLVIAGAASAALVNYLSDYTTTTATMTSPIEMSVNMGRNGNPSDEKSISINTTGGSDFTFTIVKKNNANNTIEGFPVTVVKAPSGEKLTGKEFTKMMAEFSDEAGTQYDITDLLYVVHSDGSLEKLSNRTWDNEKLVLSFVNYSTEDTIATNSVQSYSIGAGELKWDVITITWAPNLIGTYTIYSQYANNLADYATAQYSQ